MDERIDLGRILGEGFDILKNNPQLLAPLAIIVVLSILLSILTMPMLFQFLQNLAELQEKLMVYSIVRGSAMNQLILNELLGFFAQLLSFLLLISLVAFVIWVLEVLLRTGIVVGLKNIFEGKKATLGTIFSGASSHGFRALASIILAILVLFWPLLLIVLITFISFMTGALSLMLIVLILILIFFAWSIAIMWWISSKLGLIYLITSAISLIFILMSLVSPLFSILAIPFIIISIGFLIVWLILVGFTAVYIIPTCIVFGSKNIVEEAKNAFKFTRDFTLEYGLLILVLIVIYIIVVVIPSGVISTVVSMSANPYLMAGDFSSYYEIVFSPAMMTVNYMFEFIGTVLLGAFFIVTSTLTYAYGRGIKKLKAVRKIAKSTPKSQ